MDDGGDDYYHNDADGGKSRKKKLTWTRQEELVLLAVIAVHGKYDGKIDVKPGDIFHEQHRDYLKASREQKTNKGLRWSYYFVAPLPATRFCAPTWALQRPARSRRQTSCTRRRTHCGLTSRLPRR
jgi:hypothetical protein